MYTMSLPRFSRRLFAAGLIGCVLTGWNVNAQEPVSAKEDESPPVSSTLPQGPLTLDQCLELGFRHQPAMDAANASLSAAYAGQRAIDKLLLPRLFMRDYKIRREQSGLGVTIANAGLTQTEWETRYAITRNFFTVQFVDAQGKVVDEVLGNLLKARDRAEKLFKNPTPDTKITKIDLDQIDIGIITIRGKKAQVENGREKALAALREAMGLGTDYPLKVAAISLVDLAVYKVQVVKKDVKGKEIKDDNGKPVIVDEYRPKYSFNKEELIASAVANRGELIQAQVAQRIAELEVCAQNLKYGWKAETFAAAGDVHSKMVPQSIYNNEYRPGGFAPEWPTVLVGRRPDRVDRASALTQRSTAVVDKAQSLVSLDVEAQYFKWKEAITEVTELSTIQKLARELPDRVQKLNPADFTSRAVIDSNITAITVRTQLNDALHMHALGLTGLERATAGAFRIFPVPAPK
jgi:outer membrane protein TolC